MRTKLVGLSIAAVVAFSQLLAGDCDSANSDLRSFYAELLSANFAGARNKIDDAIKLWPGNSRLYGWRAYCVSQRLPSQCPRTLKQPGIDLNASDRDAAREAIVDYQRALELNSRDAVASHNLAWLEHLLGDDAAAARDWQEAATIDPNNSIFHISYAMFLDEVGRVEEAVREYETGIELSPATLDSPFFTRLRTRHPDRAQAIISHCTAELENSLRHVRDPIIEARLAKFYLYENDVENAEPLLRDAANKLPNLPLVWLNLGELVEAQGHAEQAKHCYRTAILLDHSLAEPYLRSGLLQMRTDRATIATMDLQIAIARWQRANPITAAHNNRLYGGPPQLIDDLLPTTLVWYLTPCQASVAWSALSQLFPDDQEYARRTRTCEQIPSPHESGTRRN